MPEDSLEYVAVAFLDLLGHRETLRSLRRMPETPEEVIEAERKMQSTAHVALRLREDVEEFYNSFTIGGLNTPSEALGDLEGMAPGLLATPPKLTVYGLSDAVIMAVQLGSPEFEHLPPMGVHRILAASTMVMVKYLGEGYPIRGGIEIAPGSIINGELFGPALVLAYDLESHFAEYPRVLLGSQIREYLEIMGKGIDSEDENLRRAARFARASLHHCSVDNDGRAMLDFLRVGAGIVEDPKDKREIFESMYGFVNEQHMAFSKDYKKEKLRARYHRLLVYLESRESDWLSENEGS